MSCQIKEFANLVKVPEVKQLIFGPLLSKLTNVASEELPLKNCFTSLSSTGEILAFASSSTIVILASKWHSHEPGQAKNKFVVLWSKEVAAKPNERITAIICLPLIPLGKTGVGAGTDWTCIAVGFNTGSIRFYTDNGTFLLETQLHNESILGIKCQSLSPPRHSEDVAQPEEVHVIYTSAVCVLQGYSLFTTLRAHRNHIAKVQANCNLQNPESNLVCKKWGFRNQDLLNDCQVIGSTSVNLFDHLMVASMCGGFNASYRSGAPRHNLVMATGKRPFTGFHYALEGGSVPIFSDVAIAMANKVANVIGSAVPWFRGNSRTPATPEKVKGTVSEPAEAMSCRFGLSDLKREGYNIVVSPNKAFSAVTDLMGRVNLVDNVQGIVMRMFKGYRDAECGWIEAVEEKHRTADGSHDKSGDSRTRQSRPRRALFLVIYAPRKGVIDIWAIQHGNKIVTFSAGKNGRLLYINYGLFGLNDAILTSSKANKPQYSCVFIDPLGRLSEIIVPFHFALSCQSGHKTRDLHLFRKLKTFMREEDYDSDKLTKEITNTCLELKTSEIKLQILEMLMTNKNIVPEALLDATRCFDKTVSSDDNDDLEPAAKSLYLLSTQLGKAVEFYIYVQSQLNRPPNYNSIAAESAPSENELSVALQTSHRDIRRVLKLFKTVKALEFFEGKTQSKVKFEDDGRSFLNYLSCFEFGLVGSVGFRQNATFEGKCQIAKLIFQGWLYSDDSVDIWKIAAKESDIHPSVYMELALLYWLNKKFGDCLETEIIRYVDLIHAICSIGNPDEICSPDYNETSQWWRNVREILSNSTHPFHAFLAAMACRVVGATLEKNKDLLTNVSEDDNGNVGEDVKNGNDLKKAEAENAVNFKTEKKTVMVPVASHSSTSEWENVSADTCQFSLLIGNLEDITILNAIVSVRPRLDSTTQFLTLEYDEISVSLGIVISGGKGAISEIVAKWLSCAGVDPARLIDTTDIEFDLVLLAQDTMKIPGNDMPESLDEPKSKRPATVEIGIEAKSEDRTCLSSTLEKLTLLKHHFPYSLTSSVLLANLCWEYVLFWNREVTRLDVFEAAVTTLRLIPMKHMRHGICCLLWTLHVKQLMESVAKLMNKLGKLPKEKLCVQDVGLSDVQLTEFLRVCIVFLDIFLDAEILESDKCLEVKFEQLWEGHPPGPQPLASLAVLQTPAWYESVMLHLQLANVLYMMAHFNLKVTKPLKNLFDSFVQRSFFQDISDKAMPILHQDPKLDSCRTQFLRRVITASMESIHQDTSTANKFSFKQAVLWMSKCQTIASIWKINNDELRIHQVCQLYQDGFDRLADEVMIAVNDTEKLAENLLPVAGERFISHLSKVYGQNFLDEVSRISPTLTSYLRGLNYVSSNTIFTSCTNDDTIELVRKVARNLPESSCNYHLAQLMLDATLIFADGT